MKKFLEFIFIGLSTTFILSGCGSSGLNNDGNTTNNTLTVKSVELK